MKVIIQHGNSRGASRPFFVIRRVVVFVAWKGVEERRWGIFKRTSGTLIVSYTDFADALRWWRDWELDDKK